MDSSDLADTTYPARSPPGPLSPVACKTEYPRVYKVSRCPVSKKANPTCTLHVLHFTSTVHVYSSLYVYTLRPTLHVLRTMSLQQIQSSNDSGLHMPSSSSIPPSNQNVPSTPSHPSTSRLPSTQSHPSNNREGRSQAPSPEDASPISSVWHMPQSGSQEAAVTLRYQDLVTQISIERERRLGNLDTRSIIRHQ